MACLTNCLLILVFLNAQIAASEAVDYTTDIKPILVHKCYACHGVLKQQGGLRLDTGKSLIEGGQSGATINLNNPLESLLLSVLTGEAGFRMPPENEGSHLSADELDLFRNWISQGARVPDDEEPQADPKAWWSYQLISRPAIPGTESDWARNAIDRFIDQTRRQQQLSHMDEASREQWIRRVYIDLIGLPPTRKELHAFLGDDSHHAYEKVVDSLLSRPQYGERWGRHWMDIWRYSDWYGSRAINEIRYSQRHIWRWRDWIVRSLNEDKGYDQMVTEMLAADEVAGQDKDTVVATGYLGRNWYKFDRNVRLFDTVERTAEAFLGLTLRCARCHDHKYDPITQEEYYRFRAFFEPQYVRTDPVSALSDTQKDATLGPYPDDGLPVVFDHEPERPTYRFNRGDDRFPDESKVLKPGIPKALGGPELEIIPITLPAEVWYPILREGVRNTLLEKAKVAIEDAQAKLIEAKEDLRSLDLRIKERQATNDPDTVLEEIFIHENFLEADPNRWEIVKGNWKYEDGHLTLKDVTSFATIATKANHPRDFTAHLKYKTLERGSYRSVGISYDYLDTGNSQDVYTSTNDNMPTVQAFHRVAGKQTYPSEGTVYLDLKIGQLVSLDVTVKGSSLTIDVDGDRKLEYVLPVKRQDGKFSIWVHNGSAEFHELKITKLKESLETLQRRRQTLLNNIVFAEKELDCAESEFLSIQDRLRAAIAEYIQPTLNLAELKKQAVLTEVAANIDKAELEIMRIQRLPQTADTLKELENANKDLDTARAKLENPGDKYSALGLQHSKTSTGRRAALARWITHASNPRTARIAVNHLWGRHFGTPLVSTTENFGLNGKTPSHPELLNWLAAELVSNNWQMKHIHKLIVLSATYRLSSRTDPAMMKQDPDNRYYWRMNSRRMEAEVVRDSALYLAGQIDLMLGGPEIDQKSGETNFRRSLYFRNTPIEKMDFLEVFDVADPNSCYRRKQSVVPHQALAKMNSALMQNSAKLIASRLSGDDETFIRSGFETVLNREPTQAEMKLCEQFLNDQQVTLTDGTAVKFPNSSATIKAPATAPHARARENLIHVLLLHNDFVTVR